MDREINIIIPTYKRAQFLNGINYFGDFAKWCLPESQKEEYGKVLREDQMLIIPDEEDGSITKKRNWILKNVPRPLVMIDDDVKQIEYLENRKSLKCGYKVLPKEYFEWFLHEGFSLCEQFETVLWGVYQKPDSSEYEEYLPFNLTNIILGPFQGHLEHNLLFDSRVGTKDDYDMSLMVLRKYKKVFRWNKFVYRCKHGDNEGGIVSMRTMEKEIEYCRAVEKKWGRSVIKYKLEPKKPVDLLNGMVNVPIKGV